MLKNVFILTVLCGLFISSALGGTLSGRVNFDGKPPKKRSIKMDADPVCGSAHKEPVYNQSFIINEAGYLQNVLVYLKDVKYNGNTPDTQAVLDQNGCMYSPHVQGMMVGQDLLIKNSDATLHNIHGLPKLNSEFNFAMPKVVKEKAIKMAKAENFIKIKCDVHSWMKAYISVFDHPYFAVTDDSGHYQIDNIPLGDYEVIAWQEKFKDKTLNASVTVSDSASAQNFTFVKPSKKK